MTIFWTVKSGFKNYFWRVPKVVFTRGIKSAENKGRIILTWQGFYTELVLILGGLNAKILLYLDINYKHWRSNIKTWAPKWLRSAVVDWWRSWSNQSMVFLFRMTGFSCQPDDLSDVGLPISKGNFLEKWPIRNEHLNGHLNIPNRDSYKQLINFRFYYRCLKISH